MFSNEVIIFSLFSIFVIGVLVLDLTVIGRKVHSVSYKEALIWTSVWVCCALAFYVFLFFFGDRLHSIESMDQLMLIKHKYAPHLDLVPGDFDRSISLYRLNLSTEFITGYLIEYSLSIDNVFVIMLILSAFSVKEAHIKPVLFWGILGAIILRCLFIFTGSALVQRFEWILLLFGAFLIFSGVKLFINRNKEEKIEPSKHWLVKFMGKYFPVYPKYIGKRFFIVKDRKRFITPLFIVLILVEFTDLVFAFDSIPAIFAITRDPYIVFFSNIFAIIGLRSLFFLIMKVIHIFRFLKVGITFLLIFIGIKLLFREWLHDIGFSTVHSLLMILGIIAISILASVVIKEKKPAM